MADARPQASILIVDDEPDLAGILGQFLKRVGFEVIFTTSSIEALEIFKKNPDQIALLLTDLTMPHLDGADLAAKMKAIKPDLPVILCTGYGEEVGRQQARTLQLAACLAKPVTRDELVAAVRSALNSAGQNLSTLDLSAQCMYSNNILDSE